METRRELFFTAFPPRPLAEGGFERGNSFNAECGQIAEQRFVTLGEARGDFVKVISGVQPGEEVVTSGVFKLSNGTKLAIDNSLAPKPELSPKPKES